MLWYEFWERKVLEISFNPIISSNECAYSTPGACYRCPECRWDSRDKWDASFCVPFSPSLQSWTYCECIDRQFIVIWTMYQGENLKLAIVILIEKTLSLFTWLRYALASRFNKKAQSNCLYHHYRSKWSGQKMAKFKSNWSVFEGGHAFLIVFFIIKLSSCYLFCQQT